MANHKSAVKRNLQNQKRRLRNRTVKTRIKGIVKKAGLLGKDSDANTVADELNTAKSIIDKASKKGVLHPRTAARKISRLSKRINSATAS
ncbi:MAG: 30S ribosomal protein S20 [Desulfobacteraceae bacterium]|nr:30S ribosomal protein S20 [Desulfobacteraceae bacterium]MBC2756418.1 30S ribosomal protein S20 [Desulfobacteraceae bacterium]MBC2763548.1 30S ribosomal protein S20 [ANME-2 cluster archaeon]